MGTGKFGVGGDQDYQQSVLNDQQIAHNNLALQSESDSLLQQQQDQQQQQTAAQMLSQIASGKGSAPSGSGGDSTATSMSDAFLQTAQKLQDLGAPKLAMDYYKNSQILAKDQLSNAKTVADTQKSAAETLLKQSDMLGRTLGSATSQEEWNQGIEQLQNSGAFTPQQLQQFQAIPFHPAGAQHIAQSALSVKDKAQLSMTAAGQQLTENRDAIDAQYKATRLGIDKARLEETKHQNSVQEKTGKAATAPTGPQVSSVKSAIVNQIFDGSPPKDTDALSAGAQDIASRAQTIVQGNKGLSWQTAVNRAVAESDQAGDWDIHKGAWYDPTDDDSVKFDGTGKTAEDAIPIAKGASPDTLKKGRWYITTQGRGQWDGKDFNIPQ